MDIKNYVININSSIRDAIKTIDQGGLGIVFIESIEKIIGIITDGDFRRAILKGIKLDDNVVHILNKKFIHVNEHVSEKIIINLFLENKIDRLPLLSEGKLIKIYLRENFNLEGKTILPEKTLNIPVIIMAGGKGTRMAPFTHVLPKPLIPLGERSMLEVIMDEYNKYGFNNFNLSINYKGNLIKAYFDDVSHNYNISYLQEDEFLGTAGSLKLLKLKKETPIFVSNCDILIKENYLNVLTFHKKQKNDLTLISAMVHYKVPYGVCSIKNDGELYKLSEKPEYDFLVNTGMYILNSNVLDLIPDNKFFHITHLMEKIQQNGGKVGVYPVSEKSWIDVGQWEEYKSSLKLFSNE